MTWTLPFLFIRFIIQAGGHHGVSSAVLGFLLALFLACVVLFLLGVVTRHYFPSLYRTQGAALAGRIVTTRYIQR